MFWYDEFYKLMQQDCRGQIQGSSITIIGKRKYFLIWFQSYALVGTCNYLMLFLSCLLLNAKSRCNSIAKVIWSMLKNGSNEVQSFLCSYAFLILFLGSLITFEKCIATCTLLNQTFYDQKGDLGFTMLKEKLSSRIGSSFLSIALDHIIFIYLHIFEFSFFLFPLVVKKIVWFVIVFEHLLLVAMAPPP